MRVSTAKSWLWDAVRPLFAAFAEVMVLSFFVNVLALAVPIFVMQVYDRVVFHGGISTLFGLAAGMLIAIGFDFVMRLARARILQTVALRMDVSLGRRLLDRLVALPLPVIEQRPAAAWQALFRDVDTVRNTLSGTSALLLCDVPFLLLFFVVMYVIAEPVAWVVLVMLPVFLVVAALSAGSLGGRGERERRASIGRDALIGEMIAGRATIKALALDAGLRPLWERHHAATIEAAIGRGGVADGYATFGNALTVFTTVAITAAGALAVLDQRLSIGALIAANMLSGRLLGPIAQLVGNWRALTGFLQAADRLGDVFATAVERRETAVALPRPGGSIALEAVSFRYPGDAATAARPAVDGVSLLFAPGTAAAAGGGDKAAGLHGIMGANGSGKSTLLKLLRGLYAPTAGRVLLDGADIGQFGRRDLATWIGYVPQETVLFAATVRDNIAFGHPDADDPAIIAAAEAAGLHGFVVDMPDGYATAIGEGGGRLSAGLRQRIAIARALLCRPPVLLLDEPSSHLDRSGERELVALLDRYARQATVVVVTHSVLLLQACRTITLIDAGRVALTGKGEQVLQRLRTPAPPASRERPSAAPAPVPIAGAGAAGDG